ncbi:MAG: hypothetical protein IT290_08755, partial [Deltaproteobacteria bacterium]|nr:hypothetical protein [Deltaproteobacteria bacterium]
YRTLIQPVCTKCKIGGDRFTRVSKYAVNMEVPWGSSKPHGGYISRRIGTVKLWACSHCETRSGMPKASIVVKSSGRRTPLAWDDALRVLSQSRQLCLERFGSIGEINGESMATTLSVLPHDELEHLIRALPEEVQRRVGQILGQQIALADEVAGTTVHPATTPTAQVRHDPH